MNDRKCSVSKCGAKTERATLGELKSAGWEVVRDGIQKGVPLLHCPQHAGIQPLFTGTGRK